MQSSSDFDKRKVLSALAHGSIFLSTLVLAIGVPIVLLLVSDDPVITANAKEAINFHLNYWVLAFIFGLLTFVLIGYPLLAILFIGHLVMPILAILHCFRDPERAYRYPFILRVL
ncbi:DUF4870 domain-containing protein [Leptolyngbya sp. AN02str]|uniref:DUF4870 domain-containing protein n=1 Tax=Leptolyngbya sp. AN02str TaxID=3423363 RepID=UPI003D3245A0